MAGHVQRDNVGGGRAVSSILVGIEQCGSARRRGLYGFAGLTAGSVAKVKGFDYRYDPRVICIGT